MPMKRNKKGYVGGGKMKKKAMAAGGRTTMKKQMMRGGGATGMKKKMYAGGGATMKKKMMMMLMSLVNIPLFYHFLIVLAPRGDSIGVFFKGAKA